MSIANPDKLSQIQVAKWLHEELSYKIQIARVWPFLSIDGYQLNVNRVAQFALDGSAGAIAYPLSDGANLTDQTSSPNSGSSYALGELATDYDVTYTSQDRFEHPNQLDETESALAIRKLLYSYFWLLGESNPSPAIGSGLIPGLRDIVDPTRVLSATAGGTLVEFDRAYDLVTDNNGRPNAIMSNSAVRRKYL